MKDDLEKKYGMGKMKPEMKPKKKKKGMGKKMPMEMGEKKGGYLYG